MTSWWGVLGPAGLPQPIVTRINTELVRILKSDDVKQKFATLGVTESPSFPISDESHGSHSSLWRTAASM